MKIKQVLILALLALCTLTLTTAKAQSTVITYQGAVQDEGTNFNGTGEFEFAIVTTTNTSSQATATAVMGGTAPNEYVASITVTSGGSGYVSAPIVKIPNAYQHGTAAFATVSNGMVTSVTVTSGGSGYSSAPHVGIGAPPANILYTTYWSNDGTSSDGSEPDNSVSVDVTDGLFTVGLGDTTIDNMMAIDASLFTQPNLQLEIWFNDGVNGWSPLFPLQNLTAVPYAAFAQNASNLLGALPAAQLSGTIPLAQLPAAVVTSNETGVTLSGTFSGDGSGLTNLNASQLTGFSAATQPLSGTPILNMVWIVPGTFVMGAPTSDPDYASDETQHVVTLTNGFWMGQHPVTQGEYLAVMGNNPSHFTGDLTRPVESVTWFNAGTFCTNLTQNEQSAGRLPSGWVYRLPTESEWEYCCRALTTSRYYFGNDPGDGTSLTNYAWYYVNSGNTTQPVGQLLPNAWGLVDMAGNVYEWCQDWYGTYPTANVSYNPQGPATGSYRVLRGGGWDYPAGSCRSAFRDDGDPALVFINGGGFRVVLAPGQ